jgi:hypothetical protein
LNSQTIKFSAYGNIRAFFAGLLILTACILMVVDSLLWFPARYEAGGMRPRLFLDLDYITNGWLGAGFFAACFMFFLPHWIRAVWRVVDDGDALSFDQFGLQIHPSFNNVTKLYLNSRLSAVPFDRIAEARMTNEGDLLPKGLKFLPVVAPLGARWLVKRSMKNACLFVTYDDADGRRNSLKVSAQFIEGRANALVHFCNALNLNIDSKIGKQ